MPGFGFDKYGSLKPNNNDDSAEKREKLRAQEALAVLVSLIEMDGFKVKLMRSSIVIECTHIRNGKPVFVDKLYPTISEYRAGKWEPDVTVARRIRWRHEGMCPEARQ